MKNTEGDLAGGFNGRLLGPLPLGAFDIGRFNGVLLSGVVCVQPPGRRREGGGQQRPYLSCQSGPISQ